MIPRFQLLSIGLIGVFTACGRAADGDKWAATIDTLPSGTVHVANRPRGTEQASWTLREEIRIGSVEDEGPTAFGLIKGVAVAPDGSIAVLDAQAQDIRVFDSTGKHLRTHGRQGQGPGEFSGAWGLMIGPDGMLWVPDQANARMSIVDFEKGFLKSFPMEVRSWGFVWYGGVTRDGHILEPTMTADSSRRDILRVYDSRMTPLDSLPLPPPKPSDPKRSPWAYHWKSQQAEGFIAIPFQPTPHQLMDRDGYIWSAIDDGKYRVKRWKPGGDTVVIVETERPRVSVTKAERDSAIGALRKFFRENGATDADWSRIPAAKPSIVRLFSGDAGHLWVQTSSPDSLHRYDVYQDDGRLIGSAITDLRLHRWVPPVVRGDTMWVVAMGEMDVQYVVRARIVREQ